MRIRTILGWACVLLLGVLGMNDGVHPWFYLALACAGALGFVVSTQRWIAASPAETTRPATR